MKNFEFNPGLHIPGIYFIIFSISSLFFLLLQGIMSPVLILTFILGIICFIGLLIKNRYALHFIVFSTPIIFTAYLSTAIYTFNMFRNGETMGFIAFSYVLIILAVIWVIMNVMVKMRISMAYCFEKSLLRKRAIENKIPQIIIE